MSKGKTTAITVIAIVAIFAAALFVVITKTNIFLAGDYYVKIENTQISENESSDGIINTKSSEPYLYKLKAVNAAGDEAEVEFGASRELRQGAYLRLDLQPIRGVVNWEEVPPDSVPSKAVQALD